MIKIAVYGKGGIGKSTTVSNVAAALAEMGRCARESIAVSDEQRIDEAFARYQYVINKGDVKQSLRGLRKYRLRW